MALVKWFKILSLVGLLALTACTRDEEKTSKLRLMIPAELQQNQKLNAMTTSSQLEHLVVNVSGAGIASPIVFNWDACEGSCVTPATAPPSIMLDVPSGEGRLIQVLAIYENSSELADFYYGDVTQSVLKADEFVVIPVSAIKTDVDVSGSGRIAGRFMDSASGGPTGELYVQYTPPNKPSLILEKSQMVAGWFSVFALDSLAFDYVLANGPVLFKQFTIGGFTNTATTATVSFPAQYERANGDYSNPTWRVEKGSKTILGFFGSGASAQRVCYKSSDEGYEFSRLRIAGGGLLSYSLNAASDAASNVIVSGGQECPSTLDDNYLELSPEQMDGNGGNAIAGFQVPFKFGVDSYGYLKQVQVTGAGDKFTVGYQLLPGVVTQSGLDTLHVYKVTSDQEIHFKSEGMLPCMDLEANRLPNATVSKVGSFPTSAGGFDLTMSSTEIGKTDVMLCMASGAMLKPIGMQVYRHNFYINSGGGGGGGGGGCTVNCNSNPATQIKLRHSSMPPGFMAVNQCTRIEAVTADAAGMDTNMAVGSIASGILKSNGSPIPMYESDCTTVKSSLNFNDAMMWQEAYVKFPGVAAGGTVNINFNVTSGSLTSTDNLAIVMRAGTDKFIEGYIPWRAVGGGCYSAHLSIRQYDYNNGTLTQPTTFSLASTGLSGVSFYGSSGCLSGAISSLTFSSSEIEKIFYIKFPSVTMESGFDLNIAHTSGDQVDGTSLHGMVVAGSLSVAKADHTFQGDYNYRGVNECIEVPMELVNSNGDAVENKASGLNVQLGELNYNSNVAFYSDATCTSSPVSSFPIPLNTSLMFAYMKISTAGTYTITSQISGMSGVVYSTYNISTSGGGGGGCTSNCGGGSPVRMAISHSNDPSGIAVPNQCTRIRVEAVDANGMNASLPGTVNFQIHKNTVPVSLSSDFNCSNDIGITGNISGSMGTEVYVQFADAAGTSFNLVGVDMSYTLADSMPLSMAMHNANEFYLEFGLPMSFLNDNCYTGNLKLKNLNYQDAPPGSPLTVNLVSTPAIVYPNSNCSASPVSVITFAAGTAMMPVSMKVPATAPNSFNMSISAAGMIGSNRAFQRGSGTNTLAYVKIDHQDVMNTSINTCVPIKFNFYNDSNTPIMNGVATSYSLSLGGPGSLNFYADSSCGTSLTNFSAPASLSSQVLYARATVSGSYSIASYVGSFAAFNDNLFFGSGGGGGGGGSPVAIKAEAFLKNDGSETPYINVGACTPVNVKLLDASNNLATNPNVINFSASVAGSSTLHTDPNCNDGGGASLSLTFNSGMNQNSFFVKGSSVTGNIGLTVSSGGLTQIPVNGGAGLGVQNNSGAIKVIRKWAGGLLYQNGASLATSTNQACEEYLIYNTDANGSPANDPNGTGQVNVTTQAIADAEVHSQFGCYNVPTASGTFYVPTGQSSSRFYVRYKNAISQNLTFTGATVNGSLANLQVAVNPTGSATVLRMVSPTVPNSNPINIGQCIPIVVGFADQYNMWATFAGSVSCNLNTATSPQVSYGALYSEPNCTTQIGVSTTANLGTSMSDNRGVFYYKAASGATSVNLDFNCSSGGFTSTNINFPVTGGGPVASPSTSTMTASTSVTTVNSTVMITVQARDGGGALLNMGGSNIVFNDNGMGGIFSAVNDVGDGTYNVQYTPTSQGNIVINGFMDGTPMSQNVNLTVNP